MFYFFNRFSKRAAKQCCPVAIMLKHMKSIALRRFRPNARQPA
jgi:hypothetical protein